MGARLAGWRWGALLLALLLAAGPVPAKDRPAAGAPRPFPATGAAGLPAARHLAPCGAGFAEAAALDLRRLAGGWLLAGDTGLVALAADGTVLGDLAPGRSCRAVATLPPGPGPVPADAPRLAYWVEGGSDGDGPALFQVKADGTVTRLAAEDLEALGPLTGLALDRNGTLFATGAASRDILRFDRDGGVSHQATVPDPPEPGGGLRALVLDPATGDLVVDDGWRLRRVTATGTVAGDLAGTGGAPLHLAIHGRLLVLGEPGRGELRALHLDQGRPAVLLGGPSGAGLTGPLAIGPDGRCLLARQGDLATWSLPAEPVAAPVREKPHAGAATPGGRTGHGTTGRQPHRRTARQAALDHFRTHQQAARAYKKRQRQARRSATGAGSSPAPARPRLAGMACLALLASTALADPALLAAGAPGTGWWFTPSSSPDAGLTRYHAEVGAHLDALAPICAAPVLSGRNLEPCLPAYRASILAQVRQIQAEVARLFVEPAVLGAGTCRPGEAKVHAEARIELDQGDIRAAYARLSADGAMLWYLLSKIGYEFQALGTALQLPSVLAPLGGVQPGSPAHLPAFTMAEIGHGLIALGSVFQGAGTYAGWIANRAGSYQARWERWALRQTPRLGNCTAEEATPPLAAAVPPPPLAAPLPALENTLQWLAEGCQVAAQRGLALPVCAPEVKRDLQDRNATLGQSYRAIACSSAGTLLGLQEPCEPGSGATDQDLEAATTVFEEFESQVEDPAFPAFAIGDALDAAAVGLLAGGDAALQAGNATGAALLYGGANTLFMAGNWLFASGYEFYRLASIGRAWQAVVTLDSNAIARARLDRAYDRDQADRAAASGPGGPGSATGPDGGPEPKPAPEPGPGPVAGPPAGGGGARAGGLGSGEVQVSAGTRARPFAFGALLGLSRPDSPAAGGPRPEARPDPEL